MPALIVDWYVCFKYNIYPHKIIMESLMNFIYEGSWIWWWVFFCLGGCLF